MPTRYVLSAYTGRKLVPLHTRGSVSLSRGQGESLVPPYTRGSVSLSLSLFELCFVYVIDFTLFFGLRVFIEICVIITRAGTIECKQRAGLDPDIRYVFAIFNRDTVGQYKLNASIPRFLSQMPPV